MKVFMRALFFSMACLLLVENVQGQEGEPVSTGFALWVRLPVSSARLLSASAVGSPEFAVGYRGDRFGLGLGVGLLLGRFNDDQGGGFEETVTGSVFQAGPTGWVDFWRSADGCSRGNISGGIHLGRASFTDKFTDPLFGASEDKWTGTFLSLRAGLGGDHYLDPHFALGLEAGFESAFALGVKQEGSVEEFSASLNGFYGAFRTIFAF